MRTMQHERFNEIANMPGVREWMDAGIETIDLKDMVGRPGNFCFANDDGGFVVHLLATGLYEVHTIFPPDKNLKGVIRLMHDAQEFMFTETDCQRLITRVPVHNEAALWLCKMGRFDLRSERKDEWAPGVGVRHFVLTLDRWVHACSPMLGAVGADFHGQLAAKKGTFGVEDPSHPYDEFHDIMVGLAFKMVISGNVGKGVDTYNRWAVEYGYQPMKVAWGQPLVLDIGDAVVQVRECDWEILLCR